MIQAMVDEMPGSPDSSNLPDGLWPVRICRSCVAQSPFAPRIFEDDGFGKIGKLIHPIEPSGS